MGHLYLWCVLSLLLFQNISVGLTCPLSLYWAPRSRRKVFTTFVNHAQCPSWQTHNTFSKEPTGRSHIQLVKGVPFAFICGACYSPSNLMANLTADIEGGGASLTLQPLRATNAHPNHIYEHKIDDYTVCLLSYGLTTPLESGGQITCHLNRGNRPTNEKITFSVREVPTETVGEKKVKGVDTVELVEGFRGETVEEAEVGTAEGKEIDIEVDNEGKAKLECPEADLSDKRNLIQVWYRPSSATGTSSNQAEIAVPSLDREISFIPRGGNKVTQVACAVYDMSGPKKVWIKQYKVRGRSKSEPARKAEWGVGGEEIQDDEIEGRSRLQNVLIIGAGVILGGAAIASILVCLSFGLCSCRRHPEDETAPSRKERLEGSPLKRYSLDSIENGDRKFYS